MTNSSLAQSYLIKSRHRLKVLDLLLADGAFSDVVREAQEVVEASSWLRKEREFSFYGEIDFIPTERYTRDDAERALAAARLAVKTATSVVPLPE